MSQFNIQAIKFNNVFYGGTRGTFYDIARNVLSLGDTGQVHETLHTAIQAKPLAEWTAHAGKSWIDILTDSTDIYAKKLDGTNGLILYGAKADSAMPGYASGTVHASQSCLNGVIYLAGIRWSLGQHMEFMFKAYLRSVAGSGGTDPVTESVAVALPTQVVSAEAFTLSALVLNGAAVKGVKSLELAIDPRFEHEHDTGLPFPVDVIGGGTNGPVQIRLEAEITDRQLATEGTGSVSFVATSLAQGGFLGGNTITGTLNSAWSLRSGPEGGEGGASQTRKLTCRPRWNGSTKPLTLVTA